MKRPPTWALLLIGACLLIIFAFAVFFSRGLFAVFNSYWSFGGIKRVLYQDLGLSDALSSVLATMITFIEGLVWIPVIAWPFRLLRLKFTLRQALIAFGCWVVAYGTVPILDILFGRDVCFNQATGTPEKWYVVRDGKVILFDSGGYDSLGVKKTVVTPDICRIHVQQEHSIGAHLITDPPSGIQFFDSSTGLARVWYDRGADGSIRLFDAPGYDPSTGALLSPVSRDIVAEVLAARGNSAVSPSSASEPTPPPIATSVTPPQPAQSSTESAGAVRTRALDYISAWSAPNNAGIDGLRSFYAGEVNFYGAILSPGTIMDQKIKFAERWPVRTYTARADTIAVNCLDEHFCTVSGVEDWAASNPATGAHSVGVADFSFGFRDGLIVQESGKVLSRGG
jgi:hypothetical protein